MSIATPTPIEPLIPPHRPEPAASTQLGFRMSWLTRGVPNLIVFTLLGGVLLLGHQTDWKLPKLSQLVVTHAPQNIDDWCPEHLVPESICVECHEALLPKPREFGFCRGHGVAECVTCHPELAQVTGTPRLPAYDTMQAIKVLARTENNSRNTLHKRRVQFASAESMAKSGIEVDVVQERPMSDFISANGEVTFNPSRVAHLSARVAGTVAAVFKMSGDEVRTGDILTLVDATLVGQAKSHLLQAVVQVQLKRASVDRLRGAGAGVPAKSLVEADAALAEAEILLLSARQALINLGFDVPDELEQREPKGIAVELQLLGIPQSLVESFPRGAATTNLIPVRAPSDGVVVSSDVVAGEVVDATKLLFTIADPRQMWISLSVRQEDVRSIRRGLPVLFRPDDGSAEVQGELSWISPALDERTRTLQVRVKFDNTDATLRDKTFGTGRIVLREERKSVTVPRVAIQTTSDAQFIFVRDRNFLEENGAKVFHVRQVRLGAQDARYVELLAGVLPGEVIATKGSPVLLSQLLRSNLGAGCGCHDH